MFFLTIARSALATSAPSRPCPATSAPIRPVSSPPPPPPLPPPPRTAPPDKRGKPPPAAERHVMHVPPVRRRLERLAIDPPLQARRRDRLLPDARAAEDLHAVHGVHGFRRGVLGD